MPPTPSSGWSGNISRAPGRRGVKPRPARVRDARANINGIDFRQPVQNTRSRLHIDLWQIFQILAGASRQASIDLIGVNTSAGTHQMRDYRGIVSSSRADLEDGFALLQGECVKPNRVGAGRTDVDAPFAVQCHQGILIDERGIVVRSLNIAFPGKNRPGTRSNERLTPDGRKGLLESWIASFGCGADQAGEKRP